MCKLIDIHILLIIMDRSLFKCQGGRLGFWSIIKILGDPPPTLLTKFKYNDPPWNHKKYNLTTLPILHHIVKNNIVFS